MRSHQPVLKKKRWRGGKEGLPPPPHSNRLKLQLVISHCLHNSLHIYKDLPQDIRKKNITAVFSIRSFFHIRKKFARDRQIQRQIYIKDI